MRKKSFTVSTALVSALVVGCSSADPTSSVDLVPQESLLQTSHEDPGVSAEASNPLPRHFPTQERFVRERAGFRGSSSNLGYYGGPTITSAHVVAIFWGWSTTDPISTSLQNYIATYGTSHEYNVITQYYSSGPVYIRESSLAGDTPSVWYDTTTPPTNATDAAVQGEVNTFLGQLGVSFDPSAIYEVFLPSGVYSSDGSATSCGGPNLQYCAYHGSFANSHNGSDTKYASMPYPSCGGCQTSGFSTTQNIEHFISHETREAVTDEDGNAWFDRRGYEADDKCAWSPTPFTDSMVGTNADGTGFAYQYEWSNAKSGCVKTR